MEPECLVPCLEKPGIVSYTTPNESNSELNTLMFLKNILMLSFTCTLDLRNGSFLGGRVRPKYCMHFLFPHILFVSNFLITWIELTTLGDVFKFIKLLIT